MYVYRSNINKSFGPTFPSAIWPGPLCDTKPRCPALPRHVRPTNMQPVGWRMRVRGGEVRGRRGRGRSGNGRLRRPWSQIVASFTSNLRERREAPAAVEVEEELVCTRVEACGGEREEA
jgi:hypothetical protein